MYAVTQKHERAAALGLFARNRLTEKTSLWKQLQNSLKKAIQQVYAAKDFSFSY